MLLESLSPVERAVFLLREVFGYGYEEIARTVAKNEASCRRIFTRARRRIEEGRPRFAASRAQGMELVNRFLDGQVQAIRSIVNPDKLRHPRYAVRGLHPVPETG